MIKFSVLLLVWGFILYLCIRGRIPGAMSKWNTLFGKQETIRMFVVVILFLASWFAGIVAYNSFNDAARLIGEGP